MNVRTLSACLGIAATLLITSTPAVHAAWPTDATSDGAPVCTATNTRAELQTVVSDGANGVITTWGDARNLGATGLDIYAQRLNDLGQPLWGANGVPVCASAGTQRWPVCVADGSGGAFVVWSDSARTSVYAQHLDANGTALWAANGVSVESATTSSSSYPCCLLDGAGGLFVGWRTTVGGASIVMAQRLGANGSRLWGSGVVLGNGGPSALFPFGALHQMIPDGAGGFIAFWHIESAPWRTYAQRVNAAGAIQWPLNGVSIAATRWAGLPVATYDGAGGAFVMYEDWNYPALEYSVRIQHLTAGGVRALGAGEGIPMSAPDSLGQVEAILPDGAGGCFVGWGNLVEGTVRVQHLNMAGSALWSAGGVVAASGAYARALTLADDGAGGFMVCWSDTFGMVRAQRIAATAIKKWAPASAPVFTGPGTHVGIVARGAGGYFVTSPSNLYALPHPPGNGSVFAKFLRDDGSLGPPAAVVAAVSDVPNDQGGKVLVTWKPSPLEHHPTAPVLRYHLWQRLPNASYTRIATMPAYGFVGYAFTATTTADSGAAGIGYTTFMIESESASFSAFSGADSGYSVDNLPPYPPSPLPSQMGAFGVRLHWLPVTAADVAGYRVYRGSDVNFAPVPAALLAETADTAWVDANGTGWFHKITAVDRNGNESAPATIAPSEPLAVPEGAAPLALAPPWPNPMHAGAATLLRFSLPSSGPVSLALYDAAGRRVKTLAAEDRAPGEHAVAFDGCDEARQALPAGLYFARLDACGGTRVRRLVVTQ